MHRRPDRDAASDTHGSALTAALSPLTSELAVELAPVRVNLIVSGFMDTPADVAAVAVRIMTNTAITGATCVVDRGQHLGDASVTP